MTVSVDGPGHHRPRINPIPLPELHALGLHLTSGHHTAAPPGTNTDQTDQRLAEAVSQFSTESVGADVPSVYLQALRTGTPDSRYTVPVALDNVSAAIPVHLTLARPGDGHCDPVRERDSWQELRHAVTTASQTGCDSIHPALPREIAAAAWTHNGREITACRPGSATQTLRRARLRRQLSALSPLPALSTVTQSIAGGVTAASILIAPIPACLPTSPADSGTPPPPARILDGGEIARPAPPWLPDLGGTRPAPPAPMRSLPDAVPDAAPQPPPPAPSTTWSPAPSPSPATSSPAGPQPPGGSAPAPAPTSSPSSPSLSPTPITDLLGDLGGLLSTALPAPTVAPTPAPQLTVRDKPGRRVHGHHRHRKPHPLRGLGRRR